MVAKTTENPQREELKQKFVDRLQLECSVSPDEASDKQIYQVLSALMVEKLKHKRQHFINKTNSVGGKNVYYLSMEFLMGRSLKTTLYNLELADDVRAILQDYHINLDSIFECEPDAGLGNGGLGRLAACYLDAMATQEIPATGHSICYEYGIFKQILEDGWQTEEPDNWLPGWTRSRTKPLKSTSRATYRNTGRIPITIFPMSTTTPLSRSRMTCTFPVTAVPAFLPCVCGRHRHPALT